MSDHERDDFKARVRALKAEAKRAAEAWEEKARLLPTLSPAQRAFLKRTDDPVVHWCNWAQQPSINFACGISTTPAWGQPDRRDLAKPPEPRPPAGSGMPPLECLAHLAADGSAYVFDETDRVTCKECLEALRFKVKVVAHTKKPQPKDEP